MKPFPRLGAFESTKIHGSGEDILGTTRHIDRWRHDLEMLRASGISQLRYSIPWHRIESISGRFDWDWMDGPMAYMRRHGMQPIVDPLHHTSFPDWMKGGFAHPRFPELYCRFLREFTRRYPWVEQYTVFNEPLPTTLFCSYTGMWYPHQASDECFVRMAIQVGKAMCLVAEMLETERPGVQFVHVETCETHRALDRRSEVWVEFAQQRRFLMHDLALGRIDASHPLYPYFLQHGAHADDLAWLRDHGMRFDVLGLDYYFHSELEWYWDKGLSRANVSHSRSKPAGFANVARDYVDRYEMPVMLTETNIRGTVYDRLTWLRFMEEQVETLAEGGADVRGFCWYPSIDSTDWCHACTKCTKSVDPQGIWCLDDRRWTRQSSVLSESYAKLARGQATWRDLPAYRFSPPVARELAGYIALMSHWENWVQPPVDKAA
ncbi:MAG TPA: family 1 glycosylhydrolase [Bryobacteraceae bacterium]|nr:family 1 glycosylhydrolase [Bryobacteraceae bacterium]